MSNQHIIPYDDIYADDHLVSAEVQEISYPVKAAHELDPAAFVSTYIYRIYLNGAYNYLIITGCSSTPSLTVLAVTESWIKNSLVLISASSPIRTFSINNVPTST